MQSLNFTFYSPLNNVPNNNSTYDAVIAQNRLSEMIGGTNESSPGTYFTTITSIAIIKAINQVPFFGADNFIIISPLYLFLANYKFIITL